MEVYILDMKYFLFQNFKCKTYFVEREFVRIFFFDHDKYLKKLVVINITLNENNVCANNFYILKKQM